MKQISIFKRETAKLIFDNGFAIHVNPQLCRTLRKKLPNRNRPALISGKTKLPATFTPPSRKRGNFGVQVK